LGRERKGAEGECHQVGMECKVGDRIGEFWIGTDWMVRSWSSG